MFQTASQIASGSIRSSKWRACVGNVSTLCVYVCMSDVIQTRGSCSGIGVARGIGIGSSALWSDGYDRSWWQTQDQHQ